MIAFCSIYGDIFPATLDGGYSVGGGSPAIIVRGHDQKQVNRVFATHPFQSGKIKCLGNFSFSQIAEMGVGEVLIPGFLFLSQNLDVCMF